ncbi:MAG TPA: bifunctional 4-hydroxy-2-oxoglutarate aldolase/2-dehydro-3-deoxy-phosphogluconate aldolase [Hyphomicrobiaceae bacterium]|nr:bifunctional 4-hydroxy-2-oxoglutarate aldolase/2-dehydro-3-deoxy-phosphogluconate aldolase [Hyphomicrobiaceae bacterium]
MNFTSQSERLQALLITPVIPVLTIDRLEDAVPLARALAAGGLNILEITLRTDTALDAIRDIARAEPDITLGAGTIRNPEQAAQAIDAGARFLVSPGMTPRLIEAAQRWPVSFLPGAATASEAMALADMGYGFLKFFPAEQAGGLPALKALGAPLDDIRFCPTGGIGASNASAYLALKNVVCVGGSWVAPPNLVAAADWPAITTLARKACALR